MARYEVHELKEGVLIADDSGMRKGVYENAQIGISVTRLLSDEGISEMFGDIYAGENPRPITEEDIMEATG